jgi:parallel beta-helix repeat protein
MADMATIAMPLFFSVAAIVVVPGAAVAVSWGPGAEWEAFPLQPQRLALQHGGAPGASEQQQLQQQQQRIGLRRGNGGPTVASYPDLTALFAGPQLSASAGQRPAAVRLQAANYTVAAPIVLSGPGLSIDGGGGGGGGGGGPSAGVVLSWSGDGSAAWPSILVLDATIVNLRLQGLTLHCNQRAGGVHTESNMTNVSISDVAVHDVIRGLSAFAFHATNPGVVQVGGSIRNSRIVNSFGFGVTAYSRNNGSTSGHHISGLHIDGTWGHAICLSGVTDCTVTGSTILHVNRNRPEADDCVFGHGIAVDGNAGLNPVRGLVVADNVVDDVMGISRPNCSAACSVHVNCETAGFRYRFEGIEVGDSVYGARITNNTVRRVHFGYGIYFGGGNTASDNAVIVNNTIDSCADFGIHVDSRGHARTGHAPGATRTRNVTIVGNTVRDSSPGGLVLNNLEGVTVRGNTFENSGDLAGLGLPPLCLRCTVEGNYATGAAPLSIWDPPPPPPPRPPPPGDHVHGGGGPCKEDEDCMLAGLCTAGKCVCDEGWTGPLCTRLRIQPTAASVEAQRAWPPENGSSSWGGNPIYDPIDQTWHLYCSPVAKQCGMQSWNHQQYIQHAKSTTGVTGRYEDAGVALPLFSTCPQVQRAPNGSIVILHEGTGQPPPLPWHVPVWTNCTGGTTPCCQPGCTVGGTPGCSKPPLPAVEQQAPPPPPRWPATPGCVTGHAIRKADENRSCVITWPGTGTCGMLVADGFGGPYRQFNDSVETPKNYWVQPVRVIHRFGRFLTASLLRFASHPVESLCLTCCCRDQWPFKPHTGLPRLVNPSPLMLPNGILSL